LERLSRSLSSVQRKLSTQHENVPCFSNVRMSPWDWGFGWVGVGNAGLSAPP
jgi:hypothetical protein